MELAELAELAELERVVASMAESAPWPRVERVLAVYVVDTIPLTTANNRVGQERERRALAYTHLRRRFRQP